MDLVGVISYAGVEGVNHSEGLRRVVQVSRVVYVSCLRINN